MQTNIQQVNSTEYELEILASADDLAPEIEKALKTQRARTQLKGFRPGKVPVALVKKLFGDELAYDLAQKSIQKTYETEVLDSNAYQVLGAPRLTEFDYKPDGDLRATIRFGVRPEFELADVSGEELGRLVHEVTEEDIDQSIENVRKGRANLVTVDEPAVDGDHVIVDIQPIDPVTATPIIGGRMSDVELTLEGAELESEWKIALTGKKAGDVYRQDIHHGHGHDHDHHEHEEEESSSLLVKPGEHEEHPAHPHVHSYEVTVKEVKRKDLPELDEEFIRAVSAGKAGTPEELRAYVREQVQQAWNQRSDELFKEEVINRLIRLNPIEVPDSAVEVFLDSFVADVKQRNKGQLPAHFNEEAFRAENRDEARKQAQWMLIRDKIIAEEGLEVEEEDREQHFEKIMGGAANYADYRRFYQSVPKLRDEMDQQILSNKVFESLATRFKVVDQTRETFEAATESGDEETADAVSPVEDAPEESK